MQSNKEKRRELIVYIVFGVLTTLVNMAAFQGLQWWLKPLIQRSHLLTNPIAFIVTVVFAFLVNKLFVFRQKSWEPRTVLREAASFTAMRLLSFGLDYALTHVFFEWVWRAVSSWFTPLWQKYGLFFPPERAEDAYQFLVKWGFIAVLVVVLNYIFSKYLIFHKKPKEEKGEKQ